MTELAALLLSVAPKLVEAIIANPHDAPPELIESLKAGILADRVKREATENRIDALLEDDGAADAAGKPE